MNIKINRSGVCMGDDVADHNRTYQMDKNSTYEDLFKVLIDDSYFPSISGNNVVWVLTSKHYECIFSYFTRTNKMIPISSEKSLYKLYYDNGDLSDGFMLRYYTSPKAWKEKIYEMYNGNMHELWHEGWLKELEYCDYVMSLGME
jgi:hypothetical protein